MARMTGSTCHSPGSRTLASLSPNWHQLREHRPLTSKSRNRFTLPGPGEEPLHLNKLARLRAQTAHANPPWLPLLTKARDKWKPGFLASGPRPVALHPAVPPGPSQGQERDVLTYLSLHRRQFLVHLGSPRGPVIRGLTKPGLALVYGGNEIAAPGGTARCACPATRSLVISVICHMLSPAWGRTSNLMNAFSYEDKSCPCQSN